MDIGKGGRRDEMSGNNWSLKGKEIRVFVEYGDGVDDMYPKRYIETLRQKIIKDVEEYFAKLSKEYGEDFSYVSIEVIEIINRRFGVDVDACFSMNKNNSGGDG